MINHLDNLLRQLFIAQIDEITNDLQVRFQPPNDDWRTFVGNLGGQNALNVYLVDLRENRALRSNERTRDYQNGTITQTPAPRRVDCHYLISAWSSSNETPAVEATVAEHALLYKAIDALMRSEPIVPRRVYAPNPLPVTFPAVIADEELPTFVLPTEGFLKLAEFWGTMGDHHRWKPVVYLIVTLPVVLGIEITSPMVTTRITEYRIEGHAETAEIWIEIGARVLTGAPAQPVADAWVRIEDVSGAPIATTTANTEGRFQFGGLPPGNYTLRVRAAGFAEQTRAIVVPSATGNYDVQL